MRTAEHDRRTIDARCLSAAMMMTVGRLDPSARVDGVEHT